MFVNKKYQDYLKEMNGKNQKFNLTIWIIDILKIFFYLEYENDIKNSVEQLERCINILVPPTEELFTNEDFNLVSTERVSKLPPKTNETEQKPDEENDELDDSNNAEDWNQEDDDDDEDEDDFVEVATKKSKEEIEEERYVEMRYLGVLNEANTVVSLDELKNAPALTIDLHLRENDENKVVMEVMRDLYKELKKSSLVRVQTWIKVRKIKLKLLDALFQRFFQLLFILLDTENRILHR